MQPRKPVSKRFLRMAAIYRVFADSWSRTLDFSDGALQSLYGRESYGATLSANNGYAVGKQYLNLQVTMWREDIRDGLLAKWELYEDARFPHWWLDSVLGTKARAALISEGGRR